ncbi:hypothetical protein [Fibrella aquatica]|uniref:hypothetical protein n=1 Tax=Fibrella aquatica TaxID=3242487 RepID=UPI0035200EED
MNTLETHVITLNSGSSTIKFGIYKVDHTLEPKLHGQIRTTGSSEAKSTVTYLC